MQSTGTGAVCQTRKRTRLSENWDFFIELNKYFIWQKCDFNETGVKTKALGSRVVNTLQFLGIGIGIGIGQYRRLGIGIGIGPIFKLGIGQ